MVSLRSVGQDGAPHSIVVVADEALRAHVSRCAAAAGAAIEHPNTDAAVRAGWHRAPVLVLDVESARRLATAGLPRRDGVAIVCGAEPDTRAWQAALTLGARLVAVLPEQQATLSAMFTDAVEDRGGGDGSVIAVAGGGGGAGASTFAAVLAVAAARRGREVLLVDCAPFGGGIDELVGMAAEPGMRWPELRLTDGRITAGALRSALPAKTVKPARLAVLACVAEGPGPGGQAVEAVLGAGTRAGATVICDVAPGTGEVPGVVFERADLTALLVRADVRSCAAARTVAALIGRTGPEPQLVVRGPSPAGLRPAEVAERVGAQLLVAMRSEPSVATTAETGRLLEYRKGPLYAAARTVLDTAGTAAPEAVIAA